MSSTIFCTLIPTTIQRGWLRSNDAERRLSLVMYRLGADSTIFERDSSGRLRKDPWSRTMRARLFLELRKPDEHGRIWSFPAIADACPNVPNHSTVITAIQSLERAVGTTQRRSTLRK